MGHPDFRVNGRTFASLTADERRGMVMLTPADQERFVREHPAAFGSASGEWGRAGCTRVHLEAVDEETLVEALTLAWQNGVAKGPTRSKPRKPAPRAAPRRGKRPRPG
jgi:hypothetical protein